jgi:hypothetical protein
MGKWSPTKIASTAFPFFNPKWTYDNLKGALTPKPNVVETPVSPQDLLNAKISAQIAPLLMMFGAGNIAGNTPQQAQALQGSMDKGASTGAQAGSPQLYEAMVKSLGGQANPKSNYDIANMFYGTQSQTKTPEMQSGGGPNPMDMIGTAAKTADMFMRLKNLHGGGGATTPNDVRQFYNYDQGYGG